MKRRKMRRRGGKLSQARNTQPAVTALDMSKKQSIIDEEDHANAGSPGEKAQAAMRRAGGAGVSNNTNSGFLKLNEDSVNVELDTSRGGLPTNLDDYESKEQNVMAADDKTDTLENLERTE